MTNQLIQDYKTTNKGILSFYLWQYDALREFLLCVERIAEAKEEKETLWQTVLTESNYKNQLVEDEGLD